MPVKKLLFMKSCGPSWAIVLCAVALGLSGCASRLDTRGNLLDPEKVLEIQPGELTREEVVEILGSPSSITAFGSDTWYYIAQRTEKSRCFRPVAVGCLALGEKLHLKTLIVNYPFMAFDNPLFYSVLTSTVLEIR